MADVLILIGSESDREAFADAGKYSEYFGVSFALDVVSAHRNPDRLPQRLREAEAAGTRVIVAAAGMAAHLAGACAAHSTLPVIGVPLAGSHLNGLDALLSTVQMPTGVPVATVAVGKAGANNAMILAAQILALVNPKIREKLVQFKARGARL